MMKDNWAQELSQGLISPAQLESHGLLAPLGTTLETAKETEKDLAIRVPKNMWSGLSTGDESLLKQVIPTSEELYSAPDEREDPIGDERWSPVEGLTHRYPDRALLKVTYQCAMYCRFCFRKYKVSHTEYNLDYKRLEPALAYLQEHKEIWEVILTGGDPLTLTDSKLKAFLDAFAKMSHIRIVRFHTRIVSALPSRITKEFLNLLKSYPQKFWFSLHINSVSELNDGAREAIEKIASAGFPLVSQTVLLKGINATLEDLSALLRELVTLGVKPYYLHYPDLAKGTHHFRPTIEEAKALVKSLRGRLSGICVPQLIIDIPGGEGKVVLEHEWVKKDANGNWIFESPVHR